MKLDFKVIRDSVRCVDVLASRGIKLRYRVGSEYASCPCPLKCHPSGDRGNSFSVHLPSNRFQCKQSSCAKANGVGDKWGDCINLVAAMDGVGFKEAALQLTEQKSATPKNSGPTGARTTSVAASPADTLSKAQGNGNGYMREARLRVNTFLCAVVEDTNVKRTVDFVMDEIIKSYKNGKTGH
jgi:hypothetical protein